MLWPARYGGSQKGNFLIVIAAISVIAAAIVMWLADNIREPADEVEQRNFIAFGY